MAQETVLFKSEELTDRARASALLRSLADKIERGDVTLRKGQDEVKIAIPDRLTLEVKLEEEATSPVTHSLEVELEWREGGDPTGSPLTIA